MKRTSFPENACLLTLLKFLSHPMRAVILGMIGLLIGCSQPSAPSNPASQQKRWFSVLPWNGYKAAVSLTFDDGLPEHLTYVIPQLKQRNLRATFFLITSTLDAETKVNDWVHDAIPDRHEIGNHTIDHIDLTSSSRSVLEHQIVDAKTTLQNIFESPVISFAYPYGLIGAAAESVVSTRHCVARGLWGNDAYLTAESSPDWWDIPSLMTDTSTPSATYKRWIQTDLGRGSWMVLTIHGVGEDSSGYAPIPKQNFTDLLDDLKTNESNLWVAPFGEVGAYWQAEKIVESALPTQKNDALSWDWVVPSDFPRATVLKIRFTSGIRKVTQASTELLPDTKGVYSVSFDAQEMQIQQ